MTVEVRRANAEDVEALVGLQREVHELHLASRPDQFKPTKDEAVAAWFRGLLETSGASIWVAISSGELVGDAVVTEQRRVEHTFSLARHWCEVDQIVVARAHRRRGIARALLQAVVDEARANGTPGIELSSWSFNREAQAAFQHLGFTPKLVRFELTQLTTDN